MRVRVFSVLFIAGLIAQASVPNAHAARRPHKLKVLCAVALSCISCGNQNISPNIPERIPSIFTPSPSLLANRRDESVVIDARKIEEKYFDLQEASELEENTSQPVPEALLVDFSTSEQELQQTRLRYKKLPEIFNARSEGIIASALSGLNNAYLSLKALDDLYFSLRPYIENPLAVRALERIAQRHIERGNILYAKTILQEIGQSVPETLATSEALSSDAQVSQEFATLQVPEDYILSSTPLVIGDRVFVASINTKDGTLSRFLLTFDRQTGALVYAQDYGAARIYEYIMASRGTYVHFLFLFTNKLIWVDSHGYDEFNFRGESIIHIEPNSPLPEWQNFMQANASLALEPSWQLRQGILQSTQDPTFQNEESFLLAQTWRGLKKDLTRILYQNEEISTPPIQHLYNISPYSNTIPYLNAYQRVGLIDLDTLNVVRWTAEHINFLSPLSITQLPNKDIMLLDPSGMLFKLSFETGEILAQTQIPVEHGHPISIQGTSSLIAIRGTYQDILSIILFDINSMDIVSTIPIDPMQERNEQAWFDFQNSTVSIFFLTFGFQHRIREYNIRDSIWNDFTITETGNFLGMTPNRQTILISEASDILELSKTGELINRYPWSFFSGYFAEKNFLITFPQNSITIHDLEHNQTHTVKASFPNLWVSPPTIIYDNRADKILIKSPQYETVEVVDCRTFEINRIYISRSLFLGPAYRNGKNGFLTYNSGSLTFWDYDTHYDFPEESIAQGLAREED